MTEGVNRVYYVSVTFLAWPSSLFLCVCAAAFFRQKRFRSKLFIDYRLSWQAVASYSSQTHSLFFFGLGTELNYWVKTWLNAVESVLYFKRYYIPVVQRFRKSHNSILVKLDWSSNSSQCWVLKPLATIKWDLIYIWSWRLYVEDKTQAQTLLIGSLSICFSFFK